MTERPLHFRQTRSRCVDFNIDECRRRPRAAARDITSACVSLLSPTCERTAAASAETAGSMEQNRMLDQLIRTLP
jgi:hypothetical protein